MWSDIFKPFGIMFQDLIQASIVSNHFICLDPKGSFANNFISLLTSHPKDAGCYPTMHCKILVLVLFTLEILLIYLCDRNTQHFLLGFIKYELTTLRKLAWKWLPFSSPIWLAIHIGFFIKELLWLHWVHLSSCQWINLKSAEWEKPLRN